MFRGQEKESDPRVRITGSGDLLSVQRTGLGASGGGGGALQMSP